MCVEAPALDACGFHEEEQCAEGEAMIVSVVIPGRPRTWQRAGSNGRHRYTTPEMREYQKLVRASWIEQVDHASWPLECRYQVEVFLVPPNLSGVGDVDNYAKTYLDALNKHAWVDDKQVDRLTVERCAPSKEAPCAIVRVRVIEAAEAAE